MNFYFFTKVVFANSNGISLFPYYLDFFHFFFQYKNNKCAFTIFGKNSIFFSCFFFLKNLLPFYFSILEKFKIKKFCSPLIINSRLLFLLVTRMFHFTNFYFTKLFINIVNIFSLEKENYYYNGFISYPFFYKFFIVG